MGIARLYLWTLFLAAADPELERLNSTSREAWKEFEAARQAERIAVAERWSDVLWKLPLSDPNAIARAKADALHLLVHADRFEPVFARAAEFGPNDAIWEHLFPVLLEAGGRRDEFGPVIRIAAAIAENAGQERTKALAGLVAGDAQWRSGRVDQARAAFEAVARAAGPSDLAREASRRLRELTELAPGSPAPDFSLRLGDGSVVTRAGARGKAALLHFWASWCAACKEQAPLLAEVNDRYAPRLLLVSVSLDKDCDAAEKAATSSGMKWARACDGKGEDGAIASLDFHGTTLT